MSQADDPSAPEQPTGTPAGEFRAGLRAVLPIIIAVIPFALVLGALAARKGMSPLEVALMSAFVFAGSAQFVAIELWVTPPAIGALAVTALLINLRHVLMGIALSPHLARFGFGARALTLFMMADEIWALALRRGHARPLTPAYYFGLSIIFWASWVAFTMAGAVAGRLIEDPIRWGFDFAFVAVFIVILKSFWRGRTSAIIWTASAAAAFLVWTLVEGPWYVLAGAGAGMLTAVAMPPGDEPA